MLPHSHSSCRNWLNGYAISHPGAIRWRGAANLGVAAKVPIERIKAKLMIEKKDGLRPHILLYFCPLEAYNNNCQGGERYELPVADSSYV